MSAEAQRSGDDGGRAPFASSVPLSAPSTPVGAVGFTGDGPAAGETCDYCGSTALRWRKCKLICESCAQINKSCADL
jgi:hypothetical protein